MAFNAVWHKGCKEPLPHTPEKGKVFWRLKDAVKFSEDANVRMYVNWWPSHRWPKYTIDNGRIERYNK